MYVMHGILYTIQPSGFISKKNYHLNVFNGTICVCICMSQTNKRKEKSSKIKNKFKGSNSSESNSEMAYSKTGLNKSQRDSQRDDNDILAH